MLRFDRFASLYVCNLEFVIFVFAIYYSELFERKKKNFIWISLFIIHIFIELKDFKFCFSAKLKKALAAQLIF